MPSALLEVPTDVWLDMRLLPTLPRFVQLPRWERQAYDLADVVQKPKLSQLGFFHGRAVHVELRDGPAPLGALFLDGDRVFLCSLGIRRKGAMQVDLAKVDHVGRLVQNHRVALPDQLDYATVVRAIQHRAMIARIDGAAVDFELALDPRPRRSGIASATDVLQLLARPIEDRNRWAIVGGSPLATVLREQIGHHVRNLDDVYRGCANRVIRDYQLDVTEAIALPDLDALAPEDARAVLEQRVLAILRVELTDPAWATHLHDVTAWMHVDERSLPPPR